MVAENPQARLKSLTVIYNRLLEIPLLLKLDSLRSLSEDEKAVTEAFDRLAI